MSNPSPCVAPALLGEGSQDGQPSPSPGAGSLGLNFQLGHRLPVWSWANHTVHGPLSACWYFERAVVWQVNEGRGGFIISAARSTSAGSVAALQLSQSRVGSGRLIQTCAPQGFIPASCASGSISGKATLAAPNSRETSPPSRTSSGMCACAGLCRHP